MSRRTLILIVVLIIATAVLLAIALTPVRPPAPAPTKPSAVLPYAYTTLKINSSPVIFSSPVSSISAKTYTTDVTIDTGNNKVTAVQLELSFDPKLITNVDIKPGSFFVNPTELLKKINNQEGSVSYAIAGGLLTGNRSVKGQGVVATISFEEIGSADETTYIKFLPKTLVTAEGIDKSVLKTTVNAVFPLGQLTTPSIFPTNAGTSSGQPTYSR